MNCTICGIDIMYLLSGVFAPRVFIYKDIDNRGWNYHLECFERATGIKIDLSINFDNIKYDCPYCNKRGNLLNRMHIFLNNEPHNTFYLCDKCINLIVPLDNKIGSNK